MYRKKIIFISALVSLTSVGFLVTSLTSYFVAREALSTSISEQMLPLTSDNIYSEIQRDLLRPTMISSFMAADTFVRDWAIDGEQDSQRMIDYLSEIQQQFDTLTAFYVSEDSRQYYHSTGVLKTVSPDDPADIWYFSFTDSNQPSEINIDTDTADRTRVSAFINYRVEAPDGRYLGATGVGLSIAAVTALIDNYQQRYNRSIYFIDREGNVTLTGSNDQRQSHIFEQAGVNTVAEQILSSPSTSISYIDNNGNSIFLNSRLLPEFDWYLIIEQDSTGGRQSINNTLIINLLLSSVFLALILLIAHFMQRSYQKRLEQMATKDHLTGVGNRHLFRMIFDHLTRISRRYPRPISVVVIDIDHFKQVNDKHGHQRGDLVLQEVSRLVARYVRESDTLCRWGGEEFVLLLDNCSLDDAMLRAETIRMAMTGHVIELGKTSIKLTLSMGVTSYHQDETLETLMARADAALYQAKANGRNCIVKAD